MNKGPDKIFGEFIKHWRLDLNVGLTKFARMWRLIPSEISRIERGFIKPKDAELIRGVIRSLMWLERYGRGPQVGTKELTHIRVPAGCLVCGAPLMGGHAGAGERMTEGYIVVYECMASMSVKIIEDEDVPGIYEILFKNCNTLTGGIDEN